MQLGWQSNEANSVASKDMYKWPWPIQKSVLQDIYIHIGDYFQTVLATAGYLIVFRELDKAN